MIWYGMVWYEAKIPLKKSKELQNKKSRGTHEGKWSKQGYILAVLKESKIRKKFLRSSQKIS